jgi:hypothetical protein
MLFMVLFRWISASLKQRFVTRPTERPSAYG